MTTVTGTPKDVAGGSDASVWTFYSSLREGSDGDSIITPKRVRVTPEDDGTFSVELDPGFVVVDYDGLTYAVTVPDTGPVSIWDLISAAVAFPPGTSALAVASAVDAYLTQNPVQVPGGARLVALGDSITQAQDTGNLAAWTVRVTSYAREACLISGGRVFFARNAGKGGDTLAMMLDRLDTDVFPYNPTVVTVCSGTNDSFANTPLATFAATMRTIVERIRGFGALPVIVSPWPHNSSPHVDLHTNYYDWEKAYCAAEGIPFVDAMRVVADPAATMSYQTAYDSGDGMHPTISGHQAVAAVLWDALERVLPLSAPMLSAFNSDAHNLWANGMALTNTGGLADSWTFGFAPSVGTATPSIVSDADVPGNMQRVELDAATGGYWVKQGWSSGWSVGDTLRIAGAVSFIDGDDDAYLLLHTDFTGASGSTTDYYVFPPATRSVFEFDVVVPTGATHIDVWLAWNGQTPPVSATVDVGQMTVTNLTTRQVLSA